MSLILDVLCVITNETNTENGWKHILLAKYYKREVLLYITGGALEVWLESRFHNVTAKKDFLRLIKIQSFRNNHSPPIWRAETRGCPGVAHI